MQFEVEIAATPETRQHGLMHRRVLAADAGMLFDFGQVRPVSMWMRNTYIALDMLFIQPDGTISHIAADTTPLSDTIIPSGGPVLAVLELGAGISARHGIVPGDRVVHPLFGNAPS